MHSSARLSVRSTCVCYSDIRDLHVVVYLMSDLHSHPLQVLDGLGDLLMPSVTPQSTGGSTAGSTAGSMGTPVGVGGVAAAPPATPPPTKTTGGDLDSSLANLIGGGEQLSMSELNCLFL